MKVQGVENQWSGVCNIHFPQCRLSVKKLHVFPRNGSYLSNWGIVYKVSQYSANVKEVQCHSYMRLMTYTCKQYNAECGAAIYTYEQGQGVIAMLQTKHTLNHRVEPSVGWRDVPGAAESRESRVCMQVHAIWIHHSFKVHSHVLDIQHAFYLYMVCVRKRDR